MEHTIEFLPEIKPRPLFETDAEYQDFRDSFAEQIAAMRRARRSQPRVTLDEARQQAERVAKDRQQSCKV